MFAAHMNILDAGEKPRSSLDRARVDVYEALLRDAPVAGGVVDSATTDTEQVFWDAPDGPPTHQDEGEPHG